MLHLSLPRWSQPFAGASGSKLPLAWWLFLSVFLSTVSAVLACTWLIERAVHDEVHQQATAYLQNSADALREALDRGMAHWVQLHGYQTPGVVRAVKEISPDIRVLKVLHVRGDECVEAPLIGSYEKAGVDVFLFDAVAADGRVGSTGETLDPAVVASLAERIDRPFLLAGGLSDDNREDYDELTRHPHFMGIDVDTNARGADGKVSGERVEAILGAWQHA